MKKTKSLAETLKKLAPGRRPLAVAVMTLLAASSASALDWSNAQIQSGTLIGGTETTADGGKVTTIFQSSGKGIIDWAGAGNAADAGFNLAANEALNLFNGTSGTTLMRDVTGQASKILGAVNATGSIWVVNKAGVFIGSSAAVDVGKQFLAAAGDISDTDFLNGTFNFTDVSGEVWNVGTIKAGDDVILVGAKVVNQGRIQAADQLAVGGFKIGDAGTLAMNVGGGKITFTVTGDATAGAVVNEGVLENAAYVAQDMTPTADIPGLTGKFNATTDLTDGIYTTADSTVHYNQSGTAKTLTPATLGTAYASLGTYTAVRIQAQETITSLKDKGQVNAAILAMEAAAVKQSDTAETAPVAGLGTGTAGDGTLTAAKDAALKATGGELAIGDADIGKTVSIEATSNVSIGNLKGSSVSVTGAKVTAGSVIATTGEVGITAAGSVTLEGTVKARQVEVTALGGDILSGSSAGTVLLEASQATLTAAGKIGTEANPILTKVGELSAAAGYDASASAPIPTAQSGICLVQTEGDWIITDLRDFGTGDVTLVAAGDATLGDVVSATGTVSVRAGGEILDGNGAGANITARKAILAAGRGAGISDALEISLSGTEGVLLWGAGVDGGSGGCVLMNVSTVGGNPNPAAGAAPGSNVIWMVNGRYAGGDARLIASAQTADGAVFEDLPLTIRTNEVFAPFLFLSLDLGVLPPAGQGFIDYPRPVRCQTEPEEPADDRGARSGQ